MQASSVTLRAFPDERTAMSGKIHLSRVLGVALDPNHLLEIFAKRRRGEFIRFYCNQTPLKSMREALSFLGVHFDEKRHIYEFNGNTLSVPIGF